jgi:hypothetical protein
MERVRSTSSWAQRIALGAVVASATLAEARVTMGGDPPNPPRAEEPVFGPNDVPTVFFISKSDDKNRVDYGIRLDASCAPANDDALIIYWREFEKAPPVRTHPLSLLEYVPYGVTEQHRVQRSSGGGDYVLRLKQFSRPIVILTQREPDGRCSAKARSTINGAKAQLISVYAKLAGILSVDYIDLFGKDLETGTPITERIKK